jgi:hypothetical protein
MARGAGGVTYGARKAALVRQLAEGSGVVGLHKTTSNLFRDRARVRAQRLDVRGFNHVLGVDPAAGWIDAEGMTPYEDLVLAALACQCMPAVVPQLKTITLGGAVAGVGIEATSFRHGLVHHTVREMEILAGDGNVYLCTAQNEHRDLFFGFPNSYGTLGYALRVRADVLPVKRFVRVDHEMHADPGEYFKALAARCDSDADFLDGVVFGPGELVMSTASFVDEAPSTSDYTYENIYYRSLRERRTDYLTAHDYLWRWDTDWFWCSKNLGAQNRFIRRLYGRERLNSEDVHAHHALEQPVEAHRHPGSAVRTPSRVRDPGRGHPDRAGGGVPGFLPARDRHPARLDLPHSHPPGRRTLSAVSDGPGADLRQLRFLGRGAHPDQTPTRAFQPAGGAQGHGAGGHQVAVLGQLLQPRGVRCAIRRPGLSRAQGALRPGRPVAGPIREMRAAPLAGRALSC